MTGLKLKVGRPAGGTSYTVVGESAAGAQTPNTVNTYPTSIQVQAGDILGVFAASANFCTTIGTTSADITRANGIDVPAGSTQPFAPNIDERIPVSATFQPTPGITLISPNAGSISGGTSVTVAGHDLIGTTVVSLGGVPAKSFTVDSDDQITAVSRPRSSPGSVDIRVTTAAGTSPVVAADKFTYTACVVPQLKGKKLKADKKKLRKADCKLGKVKGHGKKVKKQSVKPGKVLPPGAKVNVKLD